MKIAICADTSDFEGKVADRFARCDYYAIYDHEKLHYEFLENKAKNESSGAGNKAAKILADLDVDCVLVPEIGPKAFDILNAFDIKAYRYQKNKTIRNVLYEYFDKQLALIDTPKPKGNHS